MEKKLKKIFLWFGFFASNIQNILQAQDSNNVLLRNTHPIESRPVFTLPSLNYDTSIETSSNYFATTFLESTILFDDNNKSFIPNMLNLEIIPILKEYATVLSSNASFSDKLGRFVDIVKKGSVEHHKTGIVFGGNYVFDSEKSETVKTGPSVGFAFPITFGLAHFYLSNKNISEIKRLWAEIKKEVLESNPDANSESLESTGSLSELKDFLINKKIEPLNLKFHINSPTLQHKKIFGQISLNSNIAIGDFLSAKIPNYLSINEPDLIKIIHQDSYPDEVYEMVSVFRDNGLYLPAKRFVGALYETLVKSQLNSWGHSLGSSVKTSIELVQNKIYFDSFFGSNFYFGREKKSIFLISELYQPVQMIAQTSPRITVQAKNCLVYKKNQFEYKLGHDFFYATRENIRLIYGSHRDAESTDYFSEQKVFVDAAECLAIKQHRLFFNIKKYFANSDNFFFFGIESALFSEKALSSLCLTLGWNYNF